MCTQNPTGADLPDFRRVVLHKGCGTSRKTSVNVARRGGLVIASRYWKLACYQKRPAFP